MISISNLSVHFGDRALYNSISFFIGKGERVALAGINGSGKTTLLNLIAEKKNNAVSVDGNAVLGYLPQHLHYKSDRSARNEVIRAVGDVQQLEHEVEHITQQLTERTDYESDGYMQLAEDLAHKSERLALLEPEKIEGQAVRILKGLGFTDETCDRPYDTFSGGWKMRIELAKILIREPDILLLDEPTNHLDIQSIIWFENYLGNFEGTALLISHDRRFLDNVTNRTVELIQGDLYDFPMGYTRYLDERELRLEHLKKRVKNQEKEIKRTQELIDRFRAKANKASMAKSLQKRLDRMDTIDLPDYQQKEARINFAFSRPSGKEVIHITGINKSFGSGQVLRDVSLSINRGQKVALVGKNGIGKSTLLKIMKGALPADSGEVKLGHEVHPAFFMQDEGEQLPNDKTVLKTVEDRANHDTYTQARAVCGAFLFSGEEVDKKVNVLSGGERNRVALASIAINPFNTLILDEPTNHLDIPTKERLKKGLRDFEGTVVVVSHDREFLHGLCDHVLEIKNGEVKEFLGDINEFIEREKFNWLGLEAKSGPEPRSPQPAGKTSKPSFEEQKEKRNRENKVRKLERDIETLETEIAEIEETMAGELSQEVLDPMLKSYADKKKTLSRKMAEWEKWAS